MKSSITPGEILLEEYLQPMGISQNAMARAIGVPPRAINETSDLRLFHRSPLIGPCQAMENG